MIFIYVIPAILLLVLWILAKEIQLPDGMNAEGISREFFKMSLYIYKKFCKKKRPLEAEKIRGYISVLSNSKDIEQLETEYFVKKIASVLVMVLAGCFLSAMMFVSSSSSKAVEDGRYLYRNSYGDGDVKANLVASKQSGEEIGEYDFVIKERIYTEAEANDLFEEASREAERLILKDNQTFDEIRDDLELIEKVPGYPFLISWKLDNYELMHYDGKLEKEKIPKEGALVILTATYKYNEWTWKQEFVARLLQKALTPKECLQYEVGKLLNMADEASIYEETIALPDTYNGESVSWTEQKEDNSILLLMLTLIGACVCYVVKDNELKKETEKRSHQMLADYPQLVSQLVLYLGAGMTVRNIFDRLSKNYLKGLENGEQKRFAYEELVRSSRELSSGISEAEAYERFGIRCGSQQYTRLATLLSQNLRKGNSELLKALNEESRNAFCERMDNVRKLGEEAGTKLLLPMILMLMIVMVIIMIPAYMAF